MAWMLVYLVITPYGTLMSEVDLYPTMTECFKARETLLIQRGNPSHFPVNEQAICIRTDYT